MPSISGKFDRETGIIVQIGAAVAGSFGPLADEGQAQVSVVGHFPALVDTGASCTCLSQSVVRDLGLSAVGKTEVQATRAFRAGLSLPSHRRITQRDFRTPDERKSRSHSDWVCPRDLTG